MRRLILLLVLCTVGVSALAASAEEPPAKDWEARITPYLWLTRIDGSVDTGPRDNDFSASISDVLSNFGGGAMLNASFRWRRLLVLGDVVFARLTDDLTARSVEVGPPAADIEVGPLKTDVTVYQLTGALSLGYRALDLPFPGLDAGDPRRLFVDAYVGARFWYFAQKLKFDLPPTTVGGMPVPGGGHSRKVSGSSWWVDPQIGVVLAAQPWEHWSFLLGGSVGGFGVGNASKFSWTGVVEGSWHFAERWSLVLAYKGLGFNRDFDSSSINGNLDFALHGPVLGLSYRF